VTPTAAVAVIECQGAILLIRRSERPGDPWSGQWALPGGRRDPQDVDLLATARRELAEEVGLVLPATGWRALATQIAGQHRGHGVVVAPFHLRIPDCPSLIPDATEVAATHWLALAEFADQARHRVSLLPGGGTEPWPHLPVGGVPLWGFTYRVLQALLDDMKRG
jgi:ADP-ribose pyrophosphatase YjhB (NUDIX family)